MEKLRSWMAGHNMKQVELARRMNVSEASVSLVVTGKREFTESFIGSFFLAFGADATEAVFGDGDGQPAEAEAAA